MENEKQVQPILLDVYWNDYYNNIHDEIESDLARIKKSVEILRDLRVSAAEMEVETAALYHAELWQNIEELEANKKFEDIAPS